MSRFHTGGNLRICIAASIFPPLVGGTETQALLQASSLRRQGYEATVITLRHNRSWLARDVVEGVPVRRVGGWVLGSREHLPGPLRKLAYLTGMAVMGWTLWQCRHHYDVLHVYQLNLLALPTALVCRLTGIPMLISVRAMSSRPAGERHQRVSMIAGPLDASTPFLQVDEWQSGNGDLEDLSRIGAAGVRFTRALLRRINAVVILPSSRMKSYLTAHDFRLSRTQIIPNGVDITRFAPACSRDSCREIAHTVICVAALHYIKGVDVLLQAWRLVHEQAPQARLIIVGDGPLRNQLEQLAKALDIAKYVEFVGQQSDVPSQLHRACISVLPSREEGMPNALLEAMACGLPCVATRVSGSEDVIQHGVNGLLVEPEDYKGLADVLLSLLRDPTLARRYGRVARLAIVNRYSLAYITQLYEALYESMAHGKPVEAQLACDP